MATSKDVPRSLVASKMTAASAPKSTSVVRHGYLLLVLSSAAFSVNGLLLKVILPYFDSTLIPFWRVTIVALTLGAALAVFQPQHLKVQPRHLPLLAIFGMFAVGVQQILWTLSVKLNGVSVATVLVYISPAVVAVIAWRLLKESLGHEKLVALLLSSVGVALVSRLNEIGAWNFEWLGVLVGVATGVAWATYSVFGRLSTRRYSAWTVTFYAFSFAALFLLVIRIASAITMTTAPVTLDLIFPGVAIQWWLVLAVMALGPTLGGFALYTVGLSHVPASVASLLGTLEPVLSIVLAFFVYGEVLNWLQLIGAALILWSVLLLSRAEMNGSRRT